MSFNRRWITSRLIASAALIVSAACGDRTTAPAGRAAPANDASRVISDGANGGNTDVFFLPPLVKNPNGATGYGDPIHSGLPVVIKIRDITAAGQPVIKELPASENGNHYQANWDTKSPALNQSHTYRIEVWIGTRMPAFADVDVVSNGSQLKNVNTDEYIGLQDGKTLPIKLRVETGWACVNKASCVAEVVPSTIPAGQTKIIKSNDQMNALKLEGTWNAGGSSVIIAIENITSQQGGTGCAQGLTVMLTKESCIKFTTDPPVTLTTPAIVATCLANPGDHRQLILKYDVGETPKFLEDVAPPIVCPEGTASMDPNAGRVMRLASAAMIKVSKAFRKITGTKAAYAIDLGVGGRLDVGDDFSYFSLGLPSTWEAAAGQGQTAVINQTLPVDPQVRAVALHHHGDDPLYVSTLNVTCTIIGASGSLVVGASLVNSASATSNDDGTYSCPHWKMPGTPGANTLRITSNKHDAVFLFPGETGYSTISGSFDFTSTSVAPAGVINSINLTTMTLVIDGANVNYTANLTNPGPGFSVASLQGELRQGATVRAAAGSNVVCGAGSGVFPSGACAHNFSTLASNTVGGTGTLVPGAATLHFELKYFDGVTSTLLDSKDVPVTLSAGSRTIDELDLSTTTLDIEGAAGSYDATILNTGAAIPGVATQDGVLLQGYIEQQGGETSRAAGGTLVTCASPIGTLPNGTCNTSFSFSATNTAAGSGTLVPGPANFVLELREFHGAVNTLLDRVVRPITLVALPNPILAFTHSESSGGFDTYFFTVTNRAVYSAAMFNASPSLPPCGLNTSASRTWVDFHKTNGDYIYGFCALGSPNSMDGIWFAVPTGTSPPSPVYITMTDRLLNIIYTSNQVAVPPVGHF